MDNFFSKINKKEAINFLTIFIVSLIFYSINCPPNVTVEDSGDFIMGLSSLGIVHGPSFPLYTMIGFIFSKIPIGEVGFRIAFLSAFFGSISLSLVYLLQRLLKVDSFIAILSTASLALTSVYMGQSIIAEVYSLNLFFVLLLFIFTIKANQNSSNKWVFLMGLATGSGLIHHYPLFLVSCTGLVFLFDWKTLNKDKFLFGLLGLLLGLLPFTYLVIQMNNDLDYNFGKVSNWEMLWKQFLRKGYQGVDEAGGTFTDKFLLSWSVLKLYLHDFKFLALFIPLGLFTFKKNKNYFSFLLSAIASSFLIIFLLGFTSKVLYQAVIKAYLMPHFTFLTIFIAIGMQWLFIKLKGHHIFLKVSLIILICIQGLTNIKDTTHFNDDFVYLWAKKSLESLEPNSVLILCGQEPYALYYVNKFLKVRPDVTIYDRLSIMTKENLYAPNLLFWGVKTKVSFNTERKKKEVNFIKSSNRPIYITCSDEFRNHGFPLKQTIYHHRILNSVPYKPTKESRKLDDEILQSAIESYPKTEYWLDAARNMVLFNTFSYYLSYNIKELDYFLTQLKKHKNYFDKDFIHAMLEESYNSKNIKIYNKLIQWRGTDSLNGSSLSRLCTHKASIKKYKEALQFCKKALQNSPKCNISLYNNLMFITFHTKQYSASKSWAQEVLKCNPRHKGAISLIKSIK